MTDAEPRTDETYQALRACRDWMVELRYEDREDIGGLGAAIEAAERGLAAYEWSAPEPLEPGGFNAASTEPKGSDRPRTAAPDIFAAARDYYAAGRTLVEPSPDYARWTHNCAVLLNDVLNAVEAHAAAIAEQAAEVARLRELALIFLRNWHLRARPEHDHDLVDDCPEALFVRMRTALLTPEPLPEPGEAGPK